MQAGVSFLRAVFFGERQAVPVDGGMCPLRGVGSFEDKRHAAVPAASVRAAQPREQTTKKVCLLRSRARI